MMELTEQQVFNLVVYGTAGMLLMVLTIIGLVLFFNYKSRKMAKEIEDLKKLFKK